MDRRDFVQSSAALLLAGCGYTEVDDMPQEFTLSPSPIRTSNQINATVPGYGQGLWTPQLSFGGASVGITYDSQVGDFIKIGRSCLVNVFIRLTSKGTSVGSAQVDTLPFQLPAASTGGINAVGTAAWFSMTGTFVNITPYILANTSTIVIYGLAAAGTTLGALTDAAFADNSELSMTI